MRKLLLLPLLFALACGPVAEDPAPVDSLPGDTVDVVPDKPGKGHGPGKPADSVVVPPKDSGCFNGACQDPGDPVLARTVGLSTSTFRMSPDNKLFGPGDEVSFRVCAKDTQGSPVPGLPVKVRVKAEARDIAGNYAGEDGCADLKYIVQEDDMNGDPSNGEPDSGAFILNAYIGGRVINPIQVLHDIY